MTEKIRRSVFRLLSVFFVMLMLAAGSFPAYAAALTVRTAAGALAGKQAEAMPCKKKKKKTNKKNQTETQAQTEGSQKAKEKETAPQTEGSTSIFDTIKVEEDGSYTSKEEVAVYLHTYGHLPDNFLTKKEASAKGWVSSQGNLGQVAPGMSIGGDYFGNYEEKLPVKKGRSYHECDIDSDGGYRGAKRIIYSDDGLIFYTDDHYQTFEQLWPEE